mgnify:CR=1 FL=1
MEAKEGMSHLLIYYAAIDRWKEDRGCYALLLLCVLQSRPSLSIRESGCLKTSNQIVCYFPLSLRRVVTPGRKGLMSHVSSQAFDRENPRSSLIGWFTTVRETYCTFRTCKIPVLVGPDSFIPSIWNWHFMLHLEFIHSSLKPQTESCSMSRTT